MEIIIVIIASLLASLLTFFSGFGLGTILLPVFLLFFPVEIAIALTGVVHFFNNLFKIILLGKHVDWKIAFQFGIPSIIGASLGALLLMSLTSFAPITEYYFLGKIFVVEPLKLAIAILMIYFSLIEIFPTLQSFTPSKNTLPFGGLLSGFFGGLSGHQGALRSAFLIRYGMEKETFLATGIIIACFVDITRLSMYSTNLLVSNALDHWEILLLAILAAFAGAYGGSKLLKKVTLHIVQKIVAALLLLIAIGLALGWL